MKTKLKSDVDLESPASEETPVSVIPAEESRPTSFDEVVEETVAFIKNGITGNKKAWKDIMSGSLRLIWLQSQHSSQGARNDLVPDGQKSGFNIVLDELGLPATTAYRWMGHARGFLSDYGLSDEKMPRPGSDEWERMERIVHGRVDLLNFLKLPVRPDALPADDEVLTRLRTAAELGDRMADGLLDRLAAGEISLQEATREYCKVGDPPKRPDPVMLKIDHKTLKPTGLMVKALDTLESGFMDWESFAPEARIQAAQRIRAVLAKLPKECEFRGALCNGAMESDK